MRMDVTPQSKIRIRDRTSSYISFRAPPRIGSMLLELDRHIYVREIRSSMTDGISSNGKILSTPPALMASLGIPNTTQLSSSWAMVKAPASFISKDLRENNLINIAPKFGSDLDGTIEKNSRHSTAMVRVFRLRPVQRWPEDWMRD